MAHLHRNIHMKTNIIAHLILATSLPLVNSCAFLENYQGTEADKTVAQGKTIGAAGGTLAGATAGYGIARLAGADNKTAGLIAAGAGLLGGLIGYKIGENWGRSKVRERAAYESHAAYLEANIEQSRKRITQLNRGNTALAKDISGMKQQKTALKKAGTTESIAAHNKTINEGLQRIDQNINVLDTDIRIAREATQNTAKSEELAQLRGEIARMQAGRKTYASQRSQLASLQIK